MWAIIALLLAIDLAKSALFDESEEYGAANYLAGVDLTSLQRFFTSTSRTYSLGLDIRSTDPAFGTRQCVMYVIESDLGETSYFDDFFVPCSTGVATQIDGLGHLGTDYVFYGNRTHASMITEGTVPNMAYGGSDRNMAALPETLSYSYLNVLGIQSLPPFVTRAVVLDMVGLFEANYPDLLLTLDGNKYIDLGTCFTSTHVQMELDRQELSLAKADIVLFYTGWINLFRVNSSFMNGQPGPDMSAATMLVNAGVVAIGSDTPALECYPNANDNGTYPVHQFTLKEKGVYLLENVDTRDMVTDGVKEAFFALGPAKFHGASQVVINPIAIGGSSFVAESVSPPWSTTDSIGSANYMKGINKSELKDHLDSNAKTYSLGVDVWLDDRAFGTRQCIFTVSIHSAGEATWHDGTFLPCASGVSSQIDGLGHVASGGMYYGNRSGTSMVTKGNVTNLEYGGTSVRSILSETLNYSYLNVLGIESIPAFVARVLVLDMVALFATASPSNVSEIDGTSYLKAGVAITADHIKDALDDMQESVQAGDVVIVHTGWLNLMREDPDSWVAQEPGITVAAAEYLVDRQVLAVGADTWGLEVIPSVDSGAFPAHQYLLGEQGTYILENMDSRAMIDDNVHKGLFTLGHARYYGAVQSIINPIVIAVAEGTDVDADIAVMNGMHFVCASFLAHLCLYWM